MKVETFGKKWFSNTFSNFFQKFQTCGIYQSFDFLKIFDFSKLFDVFEIFDFFQNFQNVEHRTR